MRAEVSRAIRTVVNIDSSSWPRKPSVALLLDYAAQLQKHVDSGYLDRSDQIDIYTPSSTQSSGSFRLTKIIVEDERIVDIEAPKPVPVAGTAIKAKGRSEAARLFDNETDVMD